MVGVVSVDLVPLTVMPTGLKYTDFSSFLSPTGQAGTGGGRAGASSLGAAARGDRLKPTPQRRRPAHHVWPLRTPLHRVPLEYYANCKVGSAARMPLITAAACFPLSARE
jgi:hypothetical protein